MRSSVYLKTSNISSARPDHQCSQELAQKAILAKFARPIGRNTIQLLVEQSWQWVKAAVRALTFNRYPECDCGTSTGTCDLPYNYPLPYSLLRNYE